MNSTLVSKARESAHSSPAETDGRRARAERSTGAVVEAILALIREGDPQPTLEAIAERAEVSPRTIFRHFDDVEGVFAAAVTRHLTEARPLFDGELPSPTEPLQARVAGLVEHRAALYEAIAPVRRAAIANARLHAPVRAGLDWAHGHLRDQLGRLFADELRRRSRAERALTLDALDVATSWATWEALRGDQRLPRSAARAVMARLVVGALA